MKEVVNVLATHLFDPCLLKGGLSVHADWHTCGCGLTMPRTSGEHIGPLVALPKFAFQQAEVQCLKDMVYGP